MERNPELAQIMRENSHRKTNAKTSATDRRTFERKTRREQRRKYPISELVTVTALTEERVIHKSST